MERPNEPTLLALPTELRIRIFELVLFHRDANGIIAPRADHVDLESQFNTVVLGLRYVIINGKPDFSCTVSLDQTGEAFAQLENQGRQIWEDSAVARTGHFCTLDCLLQPALTRTSTQLRAETLPIFYSINHIHFLGMNFRRAKPNLAEKSRLPSDWWRAIGDTNLSLINSLTFMVSCGMSGAVFKYSNHPRLAEIIGRYPWYTRIMAGASERRKVHQEQRLRDEIEVFNSKAAILRTPLETLRADGLQVGILETTVARLESKGSQYLRDWSALERL